MAPSNMACSRPIRALVVISTFLLLYLIFQVARSPPSLSPPSGSGEKIPEMTNDPMNDRSCGLCQRSTFCPADTGQPPTSPKANYGGQMIMPQIIRKHLGSTRPCCLWSETRRLMEWSNRWLTLKEPGILSSIILGPSLTTFHSATNSRKKHKLQRRQSAITVCAFPRYTPFDFNLFKVH